MEKPDYFPEDLRKKMRVGQLEPGLQKEIFEFAGELGLERTISTKSDLNTIIELCSSKQGKKDRRALKRAEKILGAITHLQRGAIQNMTREEHGRSEKGRNLQKPFPEPSHQTKMTVSQEMHDLFKKIGIGDENTIVQALERFGEDGCRERIELVLSSNIDLGAPNLAARLFGERPELILTPKMDGFLDLIQTIEAKIMIIDNWKTANKGAGIPPEVDFGRNPGVLLESYADIVKKLRMPLPQPQTGEGKQEGKEGGKEETKKVRHSPIEPDEFLKTLEKLGFEMVRDGPHRMMRHPDGRMACVQGNHTGEFRPGLVRTKLRELRIEEEEFVKAREG